VTAHIKIEVEGTGTEVRAALEELLGSVTTVVAEDLEPVLPITVIDEVSMTPVKKRETRVMPTVFCAYCDKQLTDKQIKSGAKYCSPACGGAAASKARKKAKEPETLSEKVKYLTGRTCLHCGKDLEEGQKKFCSRLHANRYNLNLRRGVKTSKKIKVKGDPNNLVLVAGEGALKGSALTS